MLKVYGEEHTDTAICVEGLGIGYYKASRYDKAIETHNRLTEICKKMHGGEHTHMADYNQLLGKAYLKSNNYKKALECFEEALRIRQKVPGGKRKEVAYVYRKIGKTQQMMKDAKSVESYQKSLDIYTAILGEKHIIIAKVLLDLGEAYYYVVQNYDKALELFKNAVDIRIKIFGEMNLKTAAGTVCMVMLALHSKMSERFLFMRR
eukprot:TRINITY_DN14428_c0_g1_i1.p1 TRINITY_DN14428_c0_g1~~TRINITY_DN14428_c0_g1_i1.p1  ORF type:complete len:206 (-),score=30.15 TRINITY_DN14428_c0_g1_i1:199-816(-)